MDKIKVELKNPVIEAKQKMQKDLDYIDRQMK